ncbi:MAG: hypothetical protein A3E80_01425 [Chlamydiae bacterium RIFCSPHIGHO2_12_FULL_49_9]|nr:MAG: hypothetical protein A3E80_01425 [Chlamydiae bacterium RIFCSPHIGHO2_12_FULL_49_9]
MASQISPDLPKPPTNGLLIGVRVNGPSVQWVTAEERTCSLFGEKKKVTYIYGHVLQSSGKWKSWVCSTLEGPLTLKTWGMHAGFTDLRPQEAPKFCETTPTKDLPRPEIDGEFIGVQVKPSDFFTKEPTIHWLVRKGPNSPNDLETVSSYDGGASWKTRVDYRLENLKDGQLPSQFKDLRPPKPAASPQQEPSPAPEASGAPLPPTELIVEPPIQPVELAAAPQPAPVSQIDEEAYAEQQAAKTTLHKRKQSITTRVDRLSSTFNKRLEDGKKAARYIQIAAVVAVIATIILSFYLAPFYLACFLSLSAFVAVPSAATYLSKKHYKLQMLEEVIRALAALSFREKLVAKKLEKGEEFLLSLENVHSFSRECLKGNGWTSWETEFDPSCRSQ